MFESITFVNGIGDKVNSTGNGDIFVSKEYVKWIIKNIPAKKYYLTHHHGPKLLKDIENLEMKEFNADSNLCQGPWKLKDNCLYINTWYATDNLKYFSNDTTIQTLHNLFKQCLKSFINVDLNGEIQDFIPKIDFNKFDISFAKTFLENRKNMFRKRVIIVNHHANSGQSINFNMDIPTYNASCIYKDVDFYLTGKNIDSNLQSTQNLNFTYDIHKQNGKDFNENAFIATYCDYIIGRGSGSYTFCFCENVLKNKNNFIAFTHSPYATDFGLSKFYPNKFLMVSQQNESSFMNILSNILK